MRIIRAPDYKTMPWKNGGGTTTEIVVSPEGASLDDFDWRLSMAHVGTDGPFSGFPGIDRTLSVLNGAGIRLVFADGEAATIDVGSRPFGFAADRSVTGKLVAGPIDVADGAIRCKDCQTSGRTSSTAMTVCSFSSRDKATGRYGATQPACPCKPATP
jgi:environmental stress-induced protein Ves